MWFNTASYDNWRFCISARRILVSLQSQIKLSIPRLAVIMRKLKQLFLKIEFKAGK